jgi:hypothetical protein
VPPTPTRTTTVFVAEFCAFGGVTHVTEVSSLRVAARQISFEAPPPLENKHPKEFGEEFGDTLVSQLTSSPNSTPCPSQASPSSPSPTPTGKFVPVTTISVPPERGPKLGSIAKTSAKTHVACSSSLAQSAIGQKNGFLPRETTRLSSFAYRSCLIVKKKVSASYGQSVGGMW